METSGQNKKKHVEKYEHAVENAKIRSKNEYTIEKYKYAIEMYEHSVQRYKNSVEKYKHQVRKYIYTRSKSMKPVQNHELPDKKYKHPVEE